MHPYALSHLSDAVLLRDLVSLVVQDRQTTALLLAHLAEVDARKLYVPAGYSSMHAYCVEELRLSDDAALRRIQAARAARRFPALFSAIARGALHLTGLCLLAPHLTEANVGELLEEAAGQRKWEIEAMLARRFACVGPLQATIRPVTVPDQHTEHAPAHVEVDRDGELTADPEISDVNAPAQEKENARFLLQVTVDETTREKLRHAQALLSHAVPSGDVAVVLDRALDALIATLEKRKVGVGKRVPAGRAAQRADGSGRHISTHVRRAVWERDGGQCTFVSASGHRCGARRFIEFDHVEPVARGGEASVAGVRLRCRAHNQYEAERAFGAEFMEKKREEARQAADAVAGLRGLGFRARDARRAAEQTSTLESAAVEDRLRAAIQLLGREKTKAKWVPAPG